MFVDRFITEDFDTHFLHITVFLLFSGFCEINSNVVVFELIEKPQSNFF